jgi:hypothetical protein
MKVIAMAIVYLPPCPMPQKKYMNVIARRYAQNPANYLQYFCCAPRLQPPLISFLPHWLVRQLLSRPKQKPSKHQAQRRHFGPFLLQEKD